MIGLRYPIWWGRPPRLIQTVMESLDLAGKRVATLATSDGSTYSEAQIVIDQMMKNSTQGRVLSSTTDAIKWLTDIDF
ncbi:flavodoxin [Streptococcus constellatus]|uniref:flavodoxin n=1 Tax=Streptococcus constellatus TaxID=76860 RepID=UPI00319E84E4